jgi:hypothetical protein
MNSRNAPYAEPQYLRIDITTNQQTVETHKVVRRRGLHIFYTVG